MVLQRRNDAPRHRHPRQHLLFQQHLHLGDTSPRSPNQRAARVLLPIPHCHERSIRIHVRRSLHMQQRSIQLQSVSQPVDDSRHADATESSDASPGSDSALGPSGGIIMLGNEREYMRDEVVCRWLGRHERLGAADGGIGYHSKPAGGQRDGASFNRAGKLETPLWHLLMSIFTAFASPIPSVHTCHFCHRVHNSSPYIHTSNRPCIEAIRFKHECIQPSQVARVHSPHTQTSPKEIQLQSYSTMYSST